MRTERQRRYIARRWLLLVRPMMRYSQGRRAYVLRVVGGRFGPVLRPDRRMVRRARAFDGVDRRRTSTA
jgi:hypothetical protein